MLVNIIQNTISSFISAGVSVITTNLKMWLGFETSETLGREEVVNGDFSDGTTSWSEEGNSTISIGTYEGKTDVANINITDTSTLSKIEQAFYYVNGQTYQVSVEVYLVSGSFRVDSRDGFVPVDFVSTTTTDSWQTLTATITAIQTGTDVVWFRGINAKSQFYVNSISIKELTQITPDKSGNNNVGELFTGKALYFDGDNDYVEVDGFKMSGNVSTFAFWINSNDTLGRIIDINPNRFIISFESNQLSLYDGSWKNFGTISTNVWNRCVIVTNSTSAKCYVNGVQLGVEKTITAINIGSATSAIIGANFIHNQSFFDGEMSDFQIYNSAWTTDDIAYDYANPNKLAIDNPSTSLNVTNLKGYWALSEGDGLVAYDSGTNLEEDVVDNGDFALDSDWSEGDGWDIDTANNKITRTAQSTSTSAAQGISFVSGKSYSITYTLDVSAGSFLIRLGTPGILDTPARSVSGTYTEVVTATANHTVFNLRAFDGTFAGSISNVSVREVTASDHGGLINGADYVLNQPRIPQLGMQNLSKGSNSLTFSEDFSNTVWTKGAGTSVTGGFTDPLGGNTAYKASYNGTGTGPYIFDDANNTTNMRSIWARTVSGTGQIHLTSHSDNSNSLFNLTTVWQRVSAIPISGSGVTNFYLVDFRGSSNLTEVLVWGAQIDDSTTLGGYRPTSGSSAPSTTLIPNPTIPTQDIFGSLVRDRLNSFNLDGSGYSRVDNSPTLQFGTSAFTIQAWIKPFSLVSNNRILTKGVTGNGDFMISIAGDTSVRVFAKDSNGNSLDTTNFFSTLTINSWQMITIIIDTPNNQILFYKNDGSVETKTGASWTGNFNSTQPITIGNTSSVSAGQFFDGLVSDALVYKDRVLTSDEVENNYNAGLSAHTN